MSVTRSEVAAEFVPLRAGFVHADDLHVLALVVVFQHDRVERRLLPGEANGCPAFAQYRVDPDGGHVPWALQVVELRGDRIEAIHAFLDTEAFERFGFPPRLD